MNRSKTTVVKVSILCAGLVVLVGIQGCFATKEWVMQELAPVKGQVANQGNLLNAVSGRLDQTGSQAKGDIG